MTLSAYCASKGCKGFPVQIVVNTLQKQYVRGDPDNDLDYGGDLGVFTAGNITQQKPGSFSLQFCVEGGDTYRVSRHRRREGKAALQHRDQAAW